MCRLLHPFMPYVTEDLWQRLPRRASPHAPASIMLAAYPQPQQSWQSPEVEQDMDFVLGIVAKLRNVRTGQPPCPPPQLASPPPAPAAGCTSSCMQLPQSWQSLEVEQDMDCALGIVAKLRDIRTGLPLLAAGCMSSCCSCGRAQRWSRRCTLSGHWQCQERSPPPGCVQDDQLHAPVAVSAGLKEGCGPRLPSFSFTLDIMAMQMHFPRSCRSEALCEDCGTGRLL